MSSRCIGQVNDQSLVTNSVFAGFIHEAVQENQQVILSCRRSVRGKVTWSRESAGRRDGCSSSFILGNKTSFNMRQKREIPEVAEKSSERNKTGSGNKETNTCKEWLGASGGGCTLLFSCDTRCFCCTSHNSCCDIAVTFSQQALKTC